MKPSKIQLKSIENLSIEECRQQLARLSKGLAHPARLEILRILEHKPPNDRCVCGDIVKALPLAQSSVSQHLKTLKDAGWIQGEIDGPRVCYCIIDGMMDYFQTLLKKTTQDV